MPFYYIKKALAILNRTALYVQKPLKSCQNLIKKQTFTVLLKPNVIWYLCKESINKEIPWKIIRNLCEQNIQKEIFVQAKTFKKTFETCASKKNPLKLMQGRNFKKKSFETCARKNFWDFKKNVMQIFESYFLILCRSCQNFL